MKKEAVYEMCARAAHEANRAYCLAIGDNSQVSWDDAPDWQRKSCINGVIGVIEKGNSPAASHQSWLIEKESQGWKYGPVKDAAKKEHPCMLPYEKLPADQAVKDHIFVRVVSTMCSPMLTENEVVL